MVTRRSVLAGIGGLGLGALHGGRAGNLPDGALQGQLLDRLDGKQRLLKRSFRPPNYETPLPLLDGAITPNEHFFVRWHWASIPQVDPRAWQLRVEGDAARRSLALRLDDLRHGFEQVDLTAVCQCAGNQRGLADPHVPGVQWGRGAVGNARWSGVRLRDVLRRAGLKAGAVEVAFDGGDSAILGKGPDFAKSLPLWKAQDADTLIALRMNGESLPHWNGYPARLVVPGWAGTYWVKQLTDITIRSTPLQSFWMSTAYRLPRNKFPVLARFESQESDSSVPIIEIDVNAVITHPAEGSRTRAGTPLELRGIAWDSGSGIRTVEISSDGGQQWQAAQLGATLGRYSFREWRHVLTPATPGPLRILARATSVAGVAQPEAWTANPAGYHNNAIQSLEVDIG